VVCAIGWNDWEKVVSWVLEIGRNIKFSVTSEEISLVAENG